MTNVSAGMSVGTRVLAVFTGLKGGPLSGHAPCAGTAALGHHDGELVKRVGLQACHYVAQACAVGHLKE